MLSQNDEMFLEMEFAEYFDKESSKSKEQQLNEYLKRRLELKKKKLADLEYRQKISEQANIFLTVIAFMGFCLILRRFEVYANLPEFFAMFVFLIYVLKHLER